MTTLLTTTGSDKLRYRLMIEGWPTEWATNESITHSDNADGRAVYSGLSVSGLHQRDRIIMQEAAVQADGLTFKIVPVDSRDRPTASFSDYPEPVTRLSNPLTASDIVLTDAFTTTFLPNDTVYYMGSEAFRVNTWPDADRGIWDSYASNYVTDIGNELNAVYVYDRPLTMEGRRARLYRYTSRDLGSTDGTCIWRGIVSRPPQLDRDGVTWVIQCGPITDLLQQQLAGAIQEAHPVNIYHHSQCAFGFQLQYGAGPAFGDWTVHSGIDTEQSLVDNINTLLIGQLSALGVTALDDIGLELSKENTWRIRVTTNSTVKFAFVGGSPICGTANEQPWVDEDGRQRGGLGDEQLAANKTYYMALVPDDPYWVNRSSGFKYETPVVAPLGNVAEAMMRRQNSVTPPITFTDPANDTTYPPWRIYVDTDMAGAEAVYISDSLNPSGFFAVASTDFDDDHNLNYIELEPWIGPGPQGGETPEEKAVAFFAQNSAGFLSGSASIQAVRDYTTTADHAGTITDFVAGLKSKINNASNGDNPQITDDDLSDWAIDDSLTWSDQLHRQYRFARPHTVGEVLAEECKFVCHFPRIEADGRIGLLPLPNFTDGTLVDATHTLDSSGIVPPGGGGTWPGWTPQADGMITMVEIADKYVAATDDWKDKPITYQSRNAIATHKSRGKRRMSIKPFSTPTPGATSRDFRTGFGNIARKYLAAFSIDYSVIRLSVLYKHYGVLCGDAVRVTHRLVPDGSGGRGIDKMGVCIERDWPLDPGESSVGVLTIMVRAAATAGYAPAAIITAHADQGANLWNLTCSVAYDLNVLTSFAGDGVILSYFGDNAFIRLVQFATRTPTVLTGRIVGTPNGAAGTCQVQLDAEWTPGGSVWQLDCAVNPDNAHATTYQKLTSVYVAGGDQTLSDGSFARRYA